MRDSQVKDLSSRRWAFCLLVLNITQILIMAKSKGLHKQEMKSHPASYHLLGVCVNFLYTVPFVLSFFQVSAYIAMGICFPLHSVLCTLTVIINYTYLELFAFVAFAMLCIEFRALHIVCCATWPYPQPLDIFSLSPFLPLSFVPGLESRASCILSYNSATELHSSCPSSPSPQKKAFIVKTC